MSVSSHEYILLQPLVHKITPERIGSYIIAYLRDLAHKYTGIDIKLCVMTAPAEFENERRNATARAAELAGKELFSYA